MNLFSVADSSKGGYCCDLMWKPLPAKSLMQKCDIHFFVPQLFVLFCQGPFHGLKSSYDRII